MKHPLSPLVCMLLSFTAPLHAKDAPRPESPGENTLVYAPHPHFSWRREADVKINEVHCIQIARDAAFAEVVCEDHLEVVSRFVPVKGLPPAKAAAASEGGSRDANLNALLTMALPNNRFDVPSKEATL